MQRFIQALASMILLSSLLVGCTSTPAIGPFSYLAKKHTEKQRMYRAAVMALPPARIMDAAIVIESAMPLIAKQKAVSAWAGEGGAIGIGVNIMALPDMEWGEIGLQLMGAVSDLGLYYGTYSGIEALTQGSHNTDTSSSTITIHTTGDGNTYNITRD